MTTRQVSNDRATCRERALRLLDGRAHSRVELERKLRQRSFTRPEIDEVVADLLRLRLLDDRQFATQLIAEKLQQQGWGPARLGLEMRRRGIARELADELLGEICADPAVETERALALATRFLRLRRASHRRNPEDARQEHVALYRFLATRGYNGDVCRRVLDTLS